MLNLYSHQLFGEYNFSVVQADHFFEVAVEGGVFGQGGAHVNEDQLFDAGFLGHLGCASGSALAVGFIVSFHNGLFVPAHADHHVGVTCQFADRVAGLCVTGEYDASLGCIDSISCLLYTSDAADE